MLNLRCEQQRIHFNTAGLPFILSGIQYTVHVKKLLNPTACLFVWSRILGGNQRECATAVGAEQLLGVLILNICGHHSLVTTVFLQLCVQSKSYFPLICVWISKVVYIYNQSSTFRPFLNVTVSQLLSFMCIYEVFTVFSGTE